jgi:hypothetical protein
VPVGVVVALRCGAGRGGVGDQASQAQRRAVSSCTLGSSRRKGTEADSGITISHELERTSSAQLVFLW